MNKRFFILIALAAGFCACSNDDDKLLQEEPAPERKISIEVIENPMVSDGTKGSVASTRGSVISASTLSSFNMNYLSDVYTVSKSGDTWKTEPKTWPDVNNNLRITFYAYSAGTFYSGDNHLSFTVDELVTSQKDLLVATDNVSYNDAQGKVSLAFDHACAAVDFQMCISNTLKTSLGTDNLSINSVRLEKINNAGKYYYSTGWSEVSGSANYTLTTSVFSLGTSLQTLGCGTLFLIPQTFGADTGLRINYTVSGTGSGSQKETFVSMAGYQLKAGNQYTANIKLGTAHINKN